MTSVVTWNDYWEIQQETKIKRQMETFANLHGGRRS